jgi:type II secretory pathway component PulF
MVRAGETAGMLDEVLIRVATMLEADVKLRSKIKSAMTYPIIVFIMAILLSTVPCSSSSFPRSQGCSRTSGASCPPSPSCWSTRATSSCRRSAS